MERKLTDSDINFTGYNEMAASGPWRITFDTNPDDCNMYCIMCEEHSEFSRLKKERIISGRPHRRMDISIIRETIRQMSSRGLKEIIPSTMGEPLLYSHFSEIIDLCREYSIKLNLTTNGTWPGLGAEKWAERICPVTSDVKISWNGASASVQESIMKGSGYDRRIRDLRTFISVRDRIAKEGENRCRITLQVTFMESNLSELPDIVKLAADNGVDRIKGHHLWAHFPEIGNQDLRRSSDSIMRWNSIVYKCFEVANEHRRYDGSDILLENFTSIPEGIQRSMPDDWICPFLGREAWVNYEGRFDPCCAPDAERKTLGYFGNVLEDGGMPAIWESTAYRNLKKGYMGNEVCKKCNMRRPSGNVLQR